MRIGPIDSPEALLALVEDLKAAGYGAVRLPSSSAKDPTEQAAAEQANAETAEAPPQFIIEQRAQAFVVQENGSRFLQFGAYRDRGRRRNLSHPAAGFDRGAGARLRGGDRRRHIA